jgi:hypothetical protein
MPYIKREARFDLDKGRLPITPGELNYILTSEIQRYIYCRGENYQSYNDIIGALESCKLELYRRKIAPYEDEKIKENGDV